jgi:hypothetical protein
MQLNSNGRQYYQPQQYELHVFVCRASNFLRQMTATADWEIKILAKDIHKIRRIKPFDGIPILPSWYLEHYWPNKDK